MIHYHGGPMWPAKLAQEVWTGRHGLCSFYRQDQMALMAECCHSFILDNGAFSAWTKGISVDWNKYYEWVNEWRFHPGFDWALIPDVIDGSEEDNDALVDLWPYKQHGVPVWHLHESLDRLDRLVRQWPRVALGSSGEYKYPGSKKWWKRMDDEVRTVACDSQGRPRTKLHGLRMLNPKIFGNIPLATADSAYVAINAPLNASAGEGLYKTAPKWVRGVSLADKVEQYNSPAVWLERTDAAKEVPDPLWAEQGAVEDYADIH